MNQEFPDEMMQYTAKYKGRYFFKPGTGERVNALIERPVNKDDIADRFEQPILLMPRLLSRYGQRLRPVVIPQIQAWVDERVRLSQEKPHPRDGNKNELVNPENAPVW